MKRLLAGILWFYAVWYAGVVIAALFGISDLLGPIVGIAAGLLVAVDPRRVIWRVRGAALESAAQA